MTSQKPEEIEAGEKFTMEEPVKLEEPQRMKEDSIVLIVTPLVAIMKDQVRKKLTVEYRINDNHIDRLLTFCMRTHCKKYNLS